MSQRMPLSSVRPAMSAFPAQYGDAEGGISHNLSVNFSSSVGAAPNEALVLSSARDVITFVHRGKDEIQFEIF